MIDKSFLKDNVLKTWMAKECGTKITNQSLSKSINFWEYCGNNKNLYNLNSKKIYIVDIFDFKDWFIAIGIENGEMINPIICDYI